MLVTFGLVVVFILLDTFLGIILSIKAKTFNVRKLPQFIGTNLFPYIGGLLVLALASYITGEYSTQIVTIFYAAAIATEIKFIAEIKDKVTQIFGEIEMSAENKVFIHDIIVRDDADIDKITNKIIEVMQKQTTAKV